MRYQLSKNIIDRLTSNRNQSARDPLTPREAEQAEAEMQEIMANLRRRHIEQKRAELGPRTGMK